jgi:succinyl-CoA synthetase alpha subunit
VIFVPAAFAPDAILESVEARIKVIVCITEGIPVRDMIRVKHAVDESRAVLIGPNCPGLITAGEAKLGIMPGNIFTPGEVGLVSRSGTLTYQVVDELTRAGIGQTTCVGIGGDPITGATFRDVLELFAEDGQTRAVVLIGEIGGSQEEEAAEFIRDRAMKVAAFIAGRTAPPGKRMGHAGAIVSGSSGTAEAKIRAFESAGVPVAETTAQIIELVREALSREAAPGIRR